MTKESLIKKAQLYLDDQSELSTQEFVELFDKIYNKVNGDRPWEGTREEFDGTIVAPSSTVDIPADFLFIAQNTNDVSPVGYGEGAVVYRGTNRRKYKVIPASSYRSVWGKDGFCWFNFNKRKLTFATNAKATESVVYDYHAQKPVLGLSEEPWFPAEYHDIIYHGMSADDFVIQQADKNKSYQMEHQRQYDEYLTKMTLWNANLMNL